MKKKISFIQACIGSFDTYIFDEPTSGVDVQSAQIMMRIIEELKATGAAILLTSHNMDELQRVSDYVYFLDHGRIMQQGTVEELIDHAGSRSGGVRYVIEVDPERRGMLIARLAGLDSARNVQAQPLKQGVLIVSASGSFNPTALLKDLLNLDEPITGFWKQEGTLESALFES